jgi:hypothetical protein
MGSIWTFYDYVSDIGTNHVAKWIRKELSSDEEAAFDELIAMLAKTANWNDRDYGTVKSSPGLGEIRWKGDQRRTLRVIGLRSLEKKTFICLLGCNHKDNIYKPPDWLNTSISRMKAMNRDEGTICER